MYFKIATKNVKKSFKDYRIYFLTLTLAVCIFYSFNSIESQKAFMQMAGTEVNYAQQLISIISYVSVFVSIILGSLILYSNHFLIKKRNKELGLYMTLGMGKSKISTILIVETLLVGTLSLISGLIAGLLISQGLSVLVSKLFAFEMKEFTFVISIPALGKTIFYFGIIFLLVMAFNTHIISKYKIIDLLTVGRKTEEIKFKNPFVYLMTFILCLVALGTAYKIILEIGLLIDDIRFIKSILLGVIGTVLFFFSLAGFILYIMKRCKRIYFKELNIFTIKQINSKVNTNFISMSTICLMLFITIVVLSTGFGFKQALESGLEGATPFDASAYMYINGGEPVQSIEESFKTLGYSLDSEDKIVYYDEYTADTKITDLIPIAKGERIENTNVSYIKISEYNRIRALRNESPIDLEEDEVLITSNFSKALPVIKKYMAQNSTIKIKDKVYSIKNQEVIEENMQTYFMKNNILTIVINDAFCDAISKSSSNVNINFAKDNERQESQKFISIMDSYKNGSLAYDEVGFVLGNTRGQIYDGTKGMTTTILFVGIYIGIVFLISSMATLALQQLSEASDSMDRYVILRKLGVSKESIYKTIFAQTFIYFALPVILALVHSIVGIKVANEFIAMYNSPDIGGAALVTAGIFIAVYIIYFFTTYTSYKNIISARIK